MMIRKFFAGLAAAALLCAGARAAQIDIQFTGLDLVYDGTNLYDAGGAAGGDGLPATADPLLGMSFLKDGVLVGSLTTDIFADILVEGVTNIPVGAGFVVSSGNGNDFGFDLLTSLAGFGLALDIDTVSVFYLGNEIAITGGGVATQVFAQALPFGLVIDEGETVSFSFSSANLSSVSSSGGFLTGFSASGTGNVHGTLVVPEPSTMAFGLMGVATVVAARLRRRS